MIITLQNLDQIKGGLSKKKIFRQTRGKFNKILIDFSQCENDFENFLFVYDILKKINISIPKIYEVYSSKKIIVMQDFGQNSFDKITKEEQIYELLKLAVDNLIVIQNSISNTYLTNLKKYNFNELKKEISEFVDYYIPYKKITDFPLIDYYDIWENIFKSQNFDFNYFVHKDYEFINLILINDNKHHLRCGIIDFQSAFIGFKGWDLFSILENSRLDFPRKLNEELIKYFYDNTHFSIDYNTFLEQYYILNLVRQTRLIGRWTKLFNLGNKKYIKYLIPTKKRITYCLSNIKENNLKKIYEKYL